VTRTGIGPSGLGNDGAGISRVLGMDPDRGRLPLGEHPGRGGTDEPLEMTGGTATGGTVTGTFSDGQAVFESFTVSRPPCP